MSSSGSSSRKGRSNWRRHRYPRHQKKSASRNGHSNFVEEMLRATQKARNWEERFRHHSYHSDEPNVVTDELSLAEIDDMLLEASDPLSRTPLAIHYQIDEMPIRSRISYKAPPSPKKRRQSFDITAANINYEEMDETHLHDIMDQDSQAPLQIHMQIDEMPTGARVKYEPGRKLKEEEEMDAIEEALKNPDSSIQNLLDDFGEDEDDDEEIEHEDEVDAPSAVQRSISINSRVASELDGELHTVLGEMKTLSHPVPNVRFESLVMQMIASSEEDSTFGAKKGDDGFDMDTIEVPDDLLESEIERQLDGGSGGLDVSTMTFATLMKKEKPYHDSEDAAFTDFQGLKFFQNTLELLLSPAVLLPEMGGMI